jgi:hypothetical protein
VSISAAAERLRAAAREFGAHPDNPEGAVIDAMAEALIAFEEKLDATRGLPVDQLRDDFRRFAFGALNDAAKAFVRAQQWRTLIIAGGAVAIALVAGAGGGFLAGYEAAGRASALAAADIRPAFESGLGGAEWLAAMVRNNDPTQLAAACRASTYSAAGGRACRVNLWIARTEPNGS